MIAYHLEGLVRRYGQRTVLSIEQLMVPAGSVTAILGPSGAGKSTMLRLLNFLEEPDEGAICFEGRRADGEWPTLEAQREITMLFQRPLLLNASVRRNVETGLWLRRHRDPRLVEETLKRVGMSHLLQANATTLSGGEAQRVALARALVLRPRVLLLDEPTANLDPQNVALFERIIQELRVEGVTIVIVTHNLFQARRLADHVALLLEGHLVEAGPAQQLWTNPADPRTGAFLSGAMVY